MSPALAVPAFLATLAVTLAAAAAFARRLDEVGVRLGLPEVLLGLLTALAADGPEIASALVALAKGARGVGLGVVAGSNIFNLAAMIGLSALLAGRVHLPRGALLLEGTVALLGTVIAVLLVTGTVPAALAAVLFAVVLLPYLYLLVRGPDVVRRLRLRGRGSHRLIRALVEREHAPPRDVTERGLRGHALAMIAAVALIVLGSTGMVESALLVADGWHIPRVLVGVLILAPLTSLPNAYTAVRLGLAHRGSALVSETFNSNTINLVGGIAAPALFVGFGGMTTSARVDVTWLVVMTVVSLVLLGGRRGLGRAGGGLLIGLYAAFVAVQIALH